jgi:hypothetical protein
MDATFVLVTGAGGAAWYWHRVVGELEGRHRLAVDGRPRRRTTSVSD